MAHGGSISIIASWIVTWIRLGAKMKIKTKKIKEEKGKIMFWSVSRRKGKKKKRQKKKREGRERKEKKRKVK